MVVKMFKVDKVKNLFDCDLCQKILVDPVTLPCGYNTCQKHLDDLLENTNKTSKTNNFICELCHDDHSVPQKGFAINKRMQIGLDIQFNTLKLTPVYNECKIEIQQAVENLAKIERLETNSECYIYEYFEDIKLQVDIRREDLKQKIDIHSDEIIQTIQSNQRNYIKLSKEVNEITSNIEKSKKELDNFTKRFDTFEINDKKFDSIKQSVAILNADLNNVINDYYKSLGGHKNYSFKFDEIKVSDIFGRLVDFYQLKNIDSVILNTNQLKFDIQKLCQFPKSQIWDLKYRASRDGFSSESFHSKCDGIKNTLTVIKSESGNVFGGYVKEFWSSNKEKVPDRKAFIFSLINKDNKPFQAVCSTGNAMHCCSTFGPIFGYTSANDICICSNSNTNLCFTTFGYNYQHPDYPAGSSNANSILAGSERFLTVEIEVFAIKTNIFDIKPLSISST